MALSCILTFALNLLVNLLETMVKSSNGCIIFLFALF